MDVSGRDPDMLVTVEELAASLAAAAKLRPAIPTEGPSGFQIGKHLRHRRSDVEQWFQRRIKPESVRTDVAGPE